MSRTKGPFAVRAFTSKGVRPDCYEVYDTRTGACASFPCLKYQAEAFAHAKNAEHAKVPS